jgi:hypothetical protein
MRAYVIDHPEAAFVQFDRPPGGITGGQRQAAAAPEPTIFLRGRDRCRTRKVVVDI